MQNIACPSVDSERQFEHGYFADLSRARNTKKRDMGDADDSSNQMGWHPRMANATRDAEDEPDTLTSREESALNGGKTMSSSLMTDSDGLSRPGTSSDPFRLLFLSDKAPSDSLRHWHSNET